MSRQITIRKAFPLAEIKTVMMVCQSAFFAEEVKNNPELIERFAKQFAELATVFAAYEHDPLGFIALYTNDSSTKTAYISMFAILNAARGKGVGTSLLEEACKHAKQKKMSRIRLEVHRQNKSAARFYQNRGFIMVSPIEEDSFFYMEKVL